MPHRWSLQSKGRRLLLLLLLLLLHYRWAPYKWERRRRRGLQHVGESVLPSKIMQLALVMHHVQVRRRQAVVDEVLRHTSKAQVPWVD
jgi:hypothetical protein